MALVDSPNSVSNPRRYPVLLLFKKNLSMSLIRVLDVMRALSIVTCGLSGYFTDFDRLLVDLHLWFMFNE